MRHRIVRRGLARGEKPFPGDVVLAAAVGGDPLVEGGAGMRAAQDAPTSENDGGDKDKGERTSNGPGPPLLSG
jgi:hypothetical protein